MSFPDLLKAAGACLEDMIDERIAVIEQRYSDCITIPCNLIERACDRDKRLNRLYSLQANVDLALERYKARQLAVLSWMRRRARK